MGKTGFITHEGAVKNITLFAQAAGQIGADAAAHNRRVRQVGFTYLFCIPAPTADAAQTQGGEFPGNREFFAIYQEIREGAFGRGRGGLSILSK